MSSPHDMTRMGIIDGQRKKGKKEGATNKLRCINGISRCFGLDEDLTKNSKGKVIGHEKIYDKN